MYNFFLIVRQLLKCMLLTANI